MLRSDLEELPIGDGDLFGHCRGWIRFDSCPMLRVFWRGYTEPDDASGFGS